MIRVVLFLLTVAVAALGFAWLTDRPGEVVITWPWLDHTWPGHGRIETSILLAGLALVALVLAILLLWTILRGLWRSPEQVSLFFRHRRAVRGYLALSRGLIAIGAGDHHLARRSADEAARLSPGDPLTLLLSAQSAQMAGDRAGAERAFRDMIKRDDTKLLGLRGLYIEAQRRGDHHAARFAAEQAAQAAPTLGWAGQAVLDDRCAAADWQGALAALEHMKRTLDKADYRRKRAVLLTARAEAMNDSERDAALSAVMEAVKLAPGLVPAAALAGRRMAEAGEQRKARHILEAAWKLNPHPDIAEVYTDLRIGDSARERLTRMQKLAAKTPGEREGAIAVARAALDAHEFETARAALEPYLAQPTRRIATLMAEIEKNEHGDQGREREWLSRAARSGGDPAWTADGVVSEHWLPVTPSGRLDGFVWKVPLAEIGAGRPMIEAPAPAELEPAAESVVPESKVEPESEASQAQEKAERVPPAQPPKPAEAETAAKPAEQAKPAEPAEPVAEKPAAKNKPAEPVIPLVHAPDDPGPDSAVDGDPVPGPSSAAGGDTWRRIRGLFR